MGERIKGQCLCGSVQFDIGGFAHVDVCHCAMCQRWTGGAFIGADVTDGDVVISKSSTLKWYASSEWAKRGFCSDCGSSLFYRLNEAPDFWAIASGSLDMPKGERIGKEIFIDEKPDYYDLAGEQPKLTGAEFLATLNGGDE